MKTNICICYVRDRISGVKETKLLELLGDTLCVKAFIEFCKQDKIAKEEHEMVKIGELDLDEHFVPLPGNRKELVLCNGNNAEDIFKVLTADLHDDSDLEETNERGN